MSRRASASGSSATSSRLDSGRSGAPLARSCVTRAGGSALPSLAPRKYRRSVSNSSSTSPRAPECRFESCLPHLRGSSPTGRGKALRLRLGRDRLSIRHADLVEVPRASPGNAGSSPAFHVQHRARERPPCGSRSTAERRDSELTLGIKRRRFEKFVAQAAACEAVKPNDPGRRLLAPGHFVSASFRSSSRRLSKGGERSSEARACARASSVLPSFAATRARTSSGS